MPCICLLIVIVERLTLMPYTIRWYIPHEVLYLHYSGTVSGDDLRNSLQEMIQYIESSPRHLVHTISDVGEVVTPTPMKEAVSIIREVGSHPRSGWAVSIREKSPLVKMGSAMGSSIFGLRFRAFDTLEQAMVHLKYFDERLSWHKDDTPNTES